MATSQESCDSHIFQHEECDKALSHCPKVLKIASVDGGGIRGIIPATFFVRIEELTDKPIAKSFDVMAGTSTGGILTMGLNAGDENGVPLYTASKMRDIYTKRGSEIFQQSCYRKFISCMGIASYKYNADGLNKIANELVGDLKLSDSITNTLVTAYEIERDEPYHFKSSLAKLDPSFDFYMRDIVRSTSAAPMYFQPARVKNLTDETYTFIDGGIVLNNPALSATIHAKNLFPTVKPENYMVVSLGTGNTTRTIPYKSVENAGALKWASKIIPLMMDGASHTVDYQMLHILPDIEGMQRYFRFQQNIPTDLSEMDNAHPENIKRLQMIAERGVYNYFDELLQLVAKNLRENRKFSGGNLKSFTEPTLHKSKGNYLNKNTPYKQTFLTSYKGEHEPLLKQDKDWYNGYDSLSVFSDDEDSKGKLQLKEEDNNMDSDENSTSEDD